MRIATKAAALVLLVAMVVSQTACPEGKKLAPYAEDFVEGLKASRPLLEQFPQIDMRKVDTLLSLGNQLVTALKSEGGGGTDAGSIVSAIIANFDMIVAQVNGLSIPQERKNQILLGLVGARIALGIIARNIAEKAPEGVQDVGQVSRVKAFSKRKNWRCRSSQTGRFEKMEWCKAHPDVSVVETY